MNPEVFAKKQPAGENNPTTKSLSVNKKFLVKVLGLKY